MSRPWTPPGFLSVKEFALHTAEVGNWIWGTAQGAFNEKQTLAQIITDAAVGMIPVVGDVTAARDLIAVSSGLATNPEKREHRGEWVLLVIFIFALIPVFGGVIKGVGRITLRVTEAATKESGAIGKIANDMISFLNRIGHKNAETWLKSLDVLKYEKSITTKFRSFCDVIIISIHRFGIRFKAVLPQSLIARLEQLSTGFNQIKMLGDRMIPLALKDLHERLNHVKKYIHSGGVPPPDTAVTLLAQTGRKTVTYAEEARLIESSAGKKILHAGKYQQNVASAHRASRAEIDKLYRHETGFPDLLKNTDPAGDYYPAIAAASGPIRNELISGEVLFRAFGPEATTFGKRVYPSKPIGVYWGRGRVPTSAEQWRGPWAVLDEWNGNGWIAALHIPAHAKIPACTSIAAEQFGKELPGQFLEGGGRQAFIEALLEKEIISAAEKLFINGGGETVLANGMKVEVRSSGWRGVNGEIGYAESVIPGAAVLERLGATEQQTKAVRQATQAATKDQLIGSEK